MIEARTHISTMPFKFAAETAQMFFSDVEVKDDACVIRIMPGDLAKTEVLERVCMLCGNTPGLADALIESIRAHKPESPSDHGILMVIMHDDDARPSENHPLKNAERVRRALT